MCVADSAVYVPAGFTSLNSTGMDSDRGGPIAHRTPWRHDGLGLRTVDLETPRALLLGFEAADLDRGDCCRVFKNHSGVVYKGSIGKPLGSEEGMNGGWNAQHSHSQI